MKAKYWIVVLLCLVVPATAQQSTDVSIRVAQLDLLDLPGTKDCHGIPIPASVDCPDLPAQTVPLPTPTDLFSVADEQFGEIFDTLPEADRAKFIVGCLLSTSQCSIAKRDISASELAGAISKDLAQQLAVAAIDWQQHAPWCSNGVEPFPAKEKVGLPGKCDDGDMTLFNGLLCSAGIEQGCDAVRRSQDPNTGQWFRSPALVGFDANNPRVLDGESDTPRATLSEEQTWGVFLYLLRTQDRSAFEKWVGWIERDSRPCWTKVGNECVVRGLPQWCTDTNEFGACNFLPYECVVFEVLASRFYSNPLEAIQISRRLGCDMVMGATASALSILGPIVGGVGAIVPAIAGKVALHPELAAVISEKADLDDLKAFEFSSDILSGGQGVALPDLATLPLPGLETRRVCTDDLPIGLPLPDDLVPDACIDIPVPRLPSPIGIPGLPVGERFFTAAYPVQTQVLAQAAVTEPEHSAWYAWHKVAVQIYLLRMLGLEDDQLKKAASLVAKDSPRNPYFIFLKSGPTDDAARVALELCPKVGQERLSNRAQWSWERWDGEEAWRLSAYWECIFIAKLLSDVTVDVTGPSSVALAVPTIGWVYLGRYLDGGQ